MKRKHIGATLITVVTICSAALITGTALVTMTVGDYKMKQMQSNRTHNMYGADSGLDAAYDVMVRDFDAAGNYAGFKVEQLKAKAEKAIKDEIDVGSIENSNVKLYVTLEKEDIDLEKDNPTDTAEQIEKKRKIIQDNKNIVINAEFQRCFKMFLYQSWAKSYTGEYVPSVLENLNITNQQKGVKTSISYVQAFDPPKNGNAIDVYQTITSGNLKTSTVDLIGNPSIDMGPPVMTVDNMSIKNVDEFKKYDELNTYNKGNSINPNNYERRQKIKINISSKFKTNKSENGESVIGEQERTVEATYNLTIPNYDEIFFTGQQIKPYVYEAYKDKGITVFGNMVVKDMGNSKLTVDTDTRDDKGNYVGGDVYVLGKGDNNILPGASDNSPDTLTNVSTSDVVQKYKGGISLDSSTSQTPIEFTGNVFTGSTFNVQKNVNITLHKNLYATNIYAGRQNGGVGANSILNINESAIVDNDLTLKATATNIIMNNFYGINDLHVKNDDDDNTQTGKYRNSSSIIVNTYKDGDKTPSSVNIKDNAYIMGVAYIDDGDKPYQTGESVGVKGNYKAYSSETEADKGKYSFGQNSQLYLINGKVQTNGQVDPNVKVTEKEKEEHFYNFWYDNNNGKASESLDLGGVTLPRNINNVYSAGAIVYEDENGNKQVRQSNYNLDNNSKIIEMRRDFAQNVYNLGKEPVPKKGSNDTKESLLDDLYNRMPSNTNMKSDIMGDYVKFDAIGDNKADIDYEGNKGIFNSDATKKIIITSDANYKGNSTDKIYQVSSGSFSAFIVTSGDVIIDGSVEFYGNIIAGGNLIIQNSGEKKIHYKAEVAESIQRKDPQIFMRVFDTKRNVEGAKDLDESSIRIDYDLGKFLKNMLWKVAK